MSIEPGEGYRLLSSDEVVRRGDEVRILQSWVASGLIGFPVRATGCHVRRSTTDTLDDSMERLRTAMSQPNWSAALFGELPEQLRTDLHAGLTHYLEKQT